MLILYPGSLNFLLKLLTVHSTIQFSSGCCAEKTTRVVLANKDIMSLGKGLAWLDDYNKG